MSSKKLRGALLIAGTAIGAGMLALPVVTAAAGFLPASFIYLLAWIFSASTGLLLLEVGLWMPKGSNIISMAHHLLGPFGKIVAWGLYLFLFYSLTLAYVAGGGNFIVSLFAGKISHGLGIIIFTTLFGSCVYFGTRFVDSLNFILMIGLGVSYFVFIFVGFSEVNLSSLSRAHWWPAFMGLPVIFTSFSFQGIIPSLMTYMDRNVKDLRFAIIVGTFIPFLAYVVWEFLILGLVPLEGPQGLLAAKAQGWTAVEPLYFVFKQSSIYLLGQIFAAIALTTSFLGVSLGLLDFLSDGLKLAKVGWKKLFLCSLVYLPPVLIAMINPHIFLTALSYAGGIGCALLLGLLPIVMVWVGRYLKGLDQTDQQVAGGKLVLLLLSSFVVFELCIEVITKF